MDSSETEKLLYELGADGACDFANGESLLINRTMLAFHSKVFRNEFFGPSPKTKVKITNFDRDTFKTFLDCLFGIKEYTILDALLIYPIAHQYDVKECLEKCTAVLVPKQMSENVCITLNLALLYKQDDLVPKVINFIESEIGVIDLMENKKYRCLLEPVAVCKLIENIEMHSFTSELIYEWGRDYLAEHDKSVDINSFLKENGLLSKIQLSNFESVQSVFNFLKSNNGTLLDDDVYRHLETKLLGPKKSEWVKLNSSTITESIEFSRTFTASRDVSLQIFANKVIPRNMDKNRNQYINLSVGYFSRTVSSNFNRSGPYDHKNKYKNFNSQHSFPPGFITSGFSRSFGVNTTAYNLGFFPVQYAAVLCINVPPEQLTEIKSIEVKYHFNDLYKSRILKTSLCDNFKNTDQLYFTRNIVLLENK